MSLRQRVENEQENASQKIKTPLEAIHQFCVNWVGGSIYEVKNCGGDHSLNDGCDEDGICLFYSYRMAKGRPYIRIVRRMCLWCQGGSSDGVNECLTNDCMLYSYRFGKNPNITRKGNPETLRKWREQKKEASHAAKNS